MSPEEELRHGATHQGEPTYDSTLIDIPRAQRDHRAVVARHQHTGGFPGWQYLATGHRSRLERWETMRRSGVHQRAVAHSQGRSACVCGVIVLDDPQESGRWLDFFSAPGHVDIRTGETARAFFAKGGPYRVEMWCAACGDVAAIPEGIFHMFDPEVLEALRDAHVNVCRSEE